MTDDEKEDILARMVKMQQTLRSVKDACEEQARMAEAVGSTGLAFASMMIGEAIASFSSALTRFIKDAVDE